MTWLALLALVRMKLRDLPPPIDVISPPDPIDDLKELRRLTGLSEIMRASQDNVRAFQKIQKSERGYALDFSKRPR